MADAILNELLKVVPEEWQARFREIVALMDTFCKQHLNEEYKQLCREMAAVLCQSDSPASKGKAAGWAAGIIYTIGWVNFLSDPATEPFMRNDDIAKGVGVSPATMHSKAKVLREGLDVVRFDPDWCLPSMIKRNPLVWMIQDSHGMVFDVRHLPREVQVKAYEQGLIPYVPADDDDEEEGSA